MFSQVTNAIGFDVTYTGNLKVVMMDMLVHSMLCIMSYCVTRASPAPIITPITSSQIVNNTEAGEVYVLYQCGTPPPDKNSIPAGAKVFSIPLTSVVVPDTTAYAFVVGHILGCMLFLLFFLLLLLLLLFVMVCVCDAVCVCHDVLATTCVACMCLHTDTHA